MSWPTVPLSEVAEFIRGVTYKPADLTENFAEGSVVCMRTSNVQARLDESDMKSIPQHLVGSEKKMLREGDLLVSTANSWNLVGKCCWVPKLSYKATAGGFIAILRAEETKIDKRYLYHWFSSPNTQVDARNCGRQTTNISNMDVGRCLQLTLPLPPLPEQRRIAAILDKADTLRAKRREAIAKLDQLLQSVFLDMFGDPVTNPKGWLRKPLRELGAIYTGKTPPTASVGSFGGSIPFVTPGDLDSELLSTERSVTPDGAIFTKIVRPGAALVGCIGNIGKIAKARVACTFNQQINAIEWHEAEMNDEFGLAALRFEKAQMLSMASSTTLPILNKSNFSKVSIIVPPLSVQQQYAEIARSISTRRAAGTEHLRKTEDLLLSIEHAVFNQ